MYTKDRLKNCAMIMFMVLLVSHSAYGQRNNVLFVEDNAGYGTATHPDSLWHTFLINFYGIGNFGWFGPTTNKFENGPDLQTMQNYELVIWNNYDHYGQPLPLTPTLTAADQANITDYINSGGKFWLIAQDALYSGVPLAFFQNNFHLDDCIPDIINVVSTHLQGLAEAVGPEFLVTADYVTTIVFYPDHLIPQVNAHHILKDTDYNFYPGIIDNDSTTSFWTIDGRRPVLASTWEQLVTDMLDIFQVTPGITVHCSSEPSYGIRITASPTTFRYYTNISYSIPAAGYVQLYIYNAMGELVARLVSGCQQEQTSMIRWQPHVEYVEKIANGIYFARLYYKGDAVTTKLVLVD